MYVYLSFSLLDVITGGKFDPPRRPKKSDFKIRLVKDTLRASYLKITRPGKLAEMPQGTYRKPSVSLLGSEAFSEGFL